jgi:small subunit ribosomal protein S19
MEIKKKEFTYRGMTLDELKALDVREFAKHAPARARRTILRNFQEIEDFITRAKEKQANKKPIKTHTRTLVVVPQLVGMKIGVYNGKEFIFSEIVVEMLGHKLGEFALSRTKVKHGSAGVGATKGSKSQAKH